MVSSSPPSSRLRPAGNGALAHARGELRDALGGLRNLDQLLRSLRVGPRALSTVIPDVHASCKEMLAAVSELLRAVGNSLPGDRRAADALGDFMLPRIARLESELATATRHSMTAKHRLELERVVSEVARDLDCARELIDLLEEASSAPGIRLDLVELLSQTFTKNDSDASRLHVALDLPAPGLEIYVSPRVAMALFTIAAEFAASGGGAVRIALHGGPAAACRVSIGEDVRVRESASVSKTVVGPAIVCLESATRLLGAEFECHANGRELSFLWPAGSTNQKRAG